MRNRKEKRVFPGKPKVTADEVLVRLMEKAEKQAAERSRIDAEKLLVQLEDALAKLCDDNDVAKAAIQLIAERSSRIPTYTPLQFVGREAKLYKEHLADMTPEERHELELFVQGSQEHARRGYEEATVAIREFYGSLTQLLGRIAHESDRGLAVGVWRILDSYHPNLRFRFYQVKDKPRQRRAR